MRISFWIRAIVWTVFGVRRVSSSTQVGTVLFTTTDLVKKCWTESDKSLLRARLIMQDVLPDPNCIDFCKADSILILMDYFHTCYDIIGSSSYGKIQNLMLLALSDAFGGYMRTYVLPLTRRAYYAGQIRYSEAKKVFQLYEDIKVFLKTNGAGWAEPQMPCSTKFQVKPLVFRPMKGNSACKKLYMIEKRGKLRCISTKACLRSRDSNFESDSKEDDLEDTPVRSNCCEENKPTTKRPSCNCKPKTQDTFNKTDSCMSLLEDLGAKFLKNGTLEDLTDEQKRKQCNCHFSCPVKEDPRQKIIVPLPVLDDATCPHTIAVPFKIRPLRNLQSQHSAFILERYYSTVVRCMISKRNTRTDIRNFNAQFYAWLCSQVFPHLTDEVWYPGFGGVLRISETIKKFGAESSVKDPGTSDIGFMFSKGFGFDKVEGLRCRPRGKERTRDVEGQDVPYHSRRHFAIAILVISSAGLFTFCTCIFYFQSLRPRSRRNQMRLCTFKDPRASHDDWNEKLLDFEYLCKLLNKSPKVKDGECEAGEMTEIVCYDRTKGREKRETDTIKEKKTEERKGGGDAFVAVPRGRTPLWPCRPSLIRFEEVGPSVLDASRDSKWKFAKDFRDQVETIWRRYPSRFNMAAPRESQGDDKSKRKKFGTHVKRTLRTASESSTRDRKSSTCCCSETSSRSQTTETNSSSQTQVQEKFSSVTMEFFEEVIGRHKHRRKSSTKETTEESESDEEDEGSSTGSRY